MSEAVASARARRWRVSLRRIALVILFFVPSIVVGVTVWFALGPATPFSRVAPVAPSLAHDLP